MSWLLALHSSSAVLGVGLRRLEGGGEDRVVEFPLGRELSHALLDCVETVLPASAWPQLSRLAVALGPGGFTGTRLTVVLVRTLAQQLQVPLDGVGSYRLVAGRLRLDRPTWLAQELPRRGVVAGCYGPDASAPAGVVEGRPPRLYPGLDVLGELEPGAPVLPLEVNLPLDVPQLLDLAEHAQRQGHPGPWEPVLPLYPTAPVQV